MITDTVTLSSCENNLEASKILYDTIGFHNDGTIINVDKLGLIESYVIICAYSCEMGLKSILTENRIPIPEVHNLSALYNICPDEIKNKIKTDLESLFGVPATTKRWFFNHLKKINDNFYQWRYMVKRERVETDPVFLFEFAKEIFEVAKKQ